MSREELVKYLFSHFIHLGFFPVVRMTHQLAYYFSLLFNISPELYKYISNLFYDIAFFLISALALALALGRRRSFWEVFTQGHKYAIVYFVAIYYEALKASLIFPLATLSLMLTDPLFHYFIYLGGKLLFRKPPQAEVPSSRD